MKFTVGTDVGGTFTDLWVIADDGRQAVVKVPSTADLIGGVEAATSAAAGHFGLGVDNFCAAIDRFGHGTTAALNSLLTGKTARTGLLTTAGFADTLEIGRLKRQVGGLSEHELGDFMNRNRWPALVPRRLVREVPERIDRSGTILGTLDEAAAEAAIRSLGDEGVEAIAIGTLWSIANPVHEKRLAELVRLILPGVFITMSHEVAATVGEYARISTAAANAALGPIVSDYLARLDSHLARMGLRQPVLVMTGSGGVVHTPAVAAQPVTALMSGPAAGVTVCRDLAVELGVDRAITIDVGGTSFDVGTVIDGAATMRAQLSLAGADIHYPAIEIATIGAGGGSIARVHNGALSVGPQSAGAQPGPACYGRGGTQPTATDADLLLGVFAEDSFAGDMRVDREAAERAVRVNIAEPLDVGVIEAAWGIRTVLDNRMADLLRRVTIERGLDPAEFVMFANGGQGPSHAWALCLQLGIRTFIVTPTATVQSALGTGVNMLRHAGERPAHIRIGYKASPSDDQLALLNQAFAEAIGGVRQNLKGEQIDIECSLAIRYRGQAHHLDVLVPVGPLDDASIAQALERFEYHYELLYGAGSGFPVAGFEILSVRAIGSAPTGERAVARPTDALTWVGKRDVVFSNPAVTEQCDLYRTEFPAPGQQVEGPALISFPGQTLVIPPAASARTDDKGNFVVTMPHPREDNE